MRMLIVVLAAGALLALAARAETPETEAALVVTLKLEDAAISLEKVERKELVIPPERGFPQLLPRFFELRDTNQDVHFSGGLRDPRALAHSSLPAASARIVLVLPDIPQAHHLVIMQRVPSDGETSTTRKVLLEADL